MIGYSYPDWGMEEFYRREDMLQIQETIEENNFLEKKEAFINFAKEYALRFGYVFFHDEEDLLIEEISLEKVYMDISKLNLKASWVIRPNGKTFSGNLFILKKVKIGKMHLNMLFNMKHFRKLIL